MKQATMPSRTTPQTMDDRPAWPTFCDWLALLGVAWVIVTMVFSWGQWSMLASSLFMVVFMVVGTIGQVAGGRKSWILFHLSALSGLALRWGRKDIEIIGVYGDSEWAMWIGYVLSEQGYRVEQGEWEEPEPTRGRNQAMLRTRGKIFIHSPVVMNVKNLKPPPRSLLVNVHAEPDQPSSRGWTVVSLVDLDEAAAQQRLLRKVRHKLGRGKGQKPGVLSSAPYPQARWHVPPTLVLEANFQGRTKTLAVLSQAFVAAGNQPALTEARALSGLARIGKTQIALKFAASQRSHYDDIFWIEGGSRQALIDGLKMIACQVEPQDVASGRKVADRGAIVAGVDDQLVVGAVRSWLMEHGRVLVIFNMTSDAVWEEVRDFLPLRARSHILLTTCHAFPIPPAGEVLTLPVGNLNDVADGETLLLHAAGKREQDPEWPALMATARKVVARVGGFPPVLALIGHEIVSTGATVAQYLEQCDEQRVRSLLCGNGSPGAPSIGALWSAQWDRLTGTPEKELARELLFFCAFFGPQALPEAWLEHEVARLNAGRRPACTLDEAVRALRVYSFVERQDRQVTLNPCLQIWLRQRYEQRPGSDVPAIVTRVIQSIAHGFPDEHAPSFRDYLAHARVCLPYIDRYHLFLPEAVRIVDTLLDAEQTFGGNEQDIRDLLDLQNNMQNWVASS